VQGARVLDASSTLATSTGAHLRFESSFACVETSRVRIRCATLGVSRHRQGLEHLAGESRLAWHRVTARHANLLAKKNARRGFSMTFPSGARHVAMAA
jgi:hypothetical protein